MYECSLGVFAQTDKSDYSRFFVPKRCDAGASPQTGQFRAINFSSPQKNDPLIETIDILKVAFQQVSPVAWAHINLFGHYEFGKLLKPMDLDRMIDALVRMPVSRSSNEEVLE